MLFCSDAFKVDVGTMDSVSVAVPAAVVKYVESALVRLGYLYPDIAWSFDPATRRLRAVYEPEAHSGETLSKEVSGLA
jgi:hypothetical protein